MQPWSNGRVGLNGISYYGINQWQVASRQPPHLAAMCIWEGAADWYRDMTHHGGILSTFWANWYDMQVKTVQNGLGERGPRSPATGELVCGPDTLDEATLAANRCEFGDDILAHPLDDEYHRARSPDWSRVVVPFLSAANWGGQGLHPRGNFEGFMRAASTREMAGGARDRALDAFLHRLRPRPAAPLLRPLPEGGADSDWDRQPPVLLQVRHVDRFEERAEAAWPIPRTQWTEFGLDLHGQALGPASPHAGHASVRRDGRRA